MESDSVFNGMKFIMQKWSSQRWLAGSVALFCASIAGAQSVAGSASAVRMDSLEDIIVTATRQEQSISRVPVSVAAFDQHALDMVGAKDFTGIANQTPGVRIDEPRNTIAIRGIQSTGGSSPIGLYLDDAPLQVRGFGTGTTTALPAVFDVERVEILRGPQGTLFGSGSQGGTVRFITTQPSLEKYSLYSRAEASQTAYGGPSGELGAAIGGPIIEDKLGFRVSAWGRREGGYIDRIDYHDGRTIDSDANWSDVGMLRGALAWQAGNLRVTPSVLYQYRYRNNTDEYWEYWSAPSSGHFKNANPIRTWDRDSYVLPSLRVDYAFGAVDLTASTSYFQRKQRRLYDGSTYDLAAYQAPPDYLLRPYGPDWLRLGINDFRSTGYVDNQQHNLTQEIRLNPHDTSGRINWTVGLFFANNRQRNVETLNEPLDDFFLALYGANVQDLFGLPMLPGGNSYIGDIVEQDKQTALFGDVTFGLSDKLKVTVGGRVSKTQFRFATQYFGPYIADGYSITTGSASEKPWTPKLSVTYEPSDDTMFYALASKGYRIGGANSPLPQTCLVKLEAAGKPLPPSDFKSDAVWNYELGAKGRLARKVRYELSVFYLKWSGIQQSLYQPECGLSYIDNLGAAVSKGFDLHLVGQVSDALSVELAIGRVNAYNSETVYSTGDAATGQIRIREGNALYGSTPWQVVVAPRVDFTLLGRPAYLRASWEHASGYDRATPTADPQTIQYDPALPDRPAVTQTRLRAGVSFDKLDLSLFVDNLTNSHPQIGRFHWTTSDIAFLNSTIMPRTVGVTAIYRY